MPKGEDPHGRIVHNYSHEFDGISLNSVLLDNSVAYISFKDRVKLLSQVSWYFKVDLKNGYRQLPVSPKDWHTQVYSLGTTEFYVDLAMPFGKANSSKKFCAWTDLWFFSFLKRFQKVAPFHAVLGSYVDDAFGGARSRSQAQVIVDTLMAVGRATATSFNTEKTRGPATRLVILGLQYCSVSQTCRLGEKKRTKYINRIVAMLKAPETSLKLLEQVTGNLGYAAWVEPFCRPLLSCLYAAIARHKQANRIRITSFMRNALRIWHLVLHHNRGLPFTFLLDKLPAVTTPIFVDASTSWGIGGVHGSDYFSMSHDDLRTSMQTCPGWGTYPRVPIARLELLAAYVAVHLFARRYPGHYIILYTDNANVLAWLSTRRSPDPIVGTLVSAIESIKYLHLLKLAVRYIPSRRNRTADCLSRNVIPGWLRSRGSKLIPYISGIAQASNPDKLLKFWINPV